LIQNFKFDGEMEIVINCQPYSSFQGTLCGGRG
jgi:hypothetical protein